MAHFQSLAEGGTTDAEPSSDVENAFKIGYRHPWEAARAWRRNGEIINGDGGRWMIGVKWADQTLAEQLLGTGAKPYSSSISLSEPETPLSSPPQASNAMDTSPDPNFSQLQRINSSSTPSIGTPIKLAPSSSAFKKAGSGASGGKATVSAVAPAQYAPSSSLSMSPAKGVFGQVSELIFGW